MGKVGWIVLAVLAAAGVAIGLPFYLAARRKSDIAGRCAALRAELATIRTQGGDVSRAQQLEAQLSLCIEEAQAAGVEIDAAAYGLERCTQISTQIDQEWTHYRSTATEDAVKRNNGRGQILRLGEELARCFDSQVDGAKDLEGVRRLRNAVVAAIAASETRRRCFARSEPGCSRYGLNEPDLPEKEADERTRVLAPLIAVRSKLDRKLAQLDQAYAARRAEQIQQQADEYQRMRALGRV